MRSKDDKLSEQQKLFCYEYIIDFNASGAYKRAGYTAKGNSAEAAANRLLKNPNVQELIDKLTENKVVNAVTKAEDVIAELTKIAFADDEYILIDKLKVSDKIKALELLGQHLGGLFTKKVDITTNGNDVNGVVVKSYVVPAFKDFVEKPE